MQGYAAARPTRVQAVGRVDRTLRQAAGRRRTAQDLTGARSPVAKPCSHTRIRKGKVNVAVGVGKRGGGNSSGGTTDQPREVQWITYCSCDNRPREDHWTDSRLGSALLASNVKFLQATQHKQGQAPRKQDKGHKTRLQGRASGALHS
jgi:hypothetical protein